MPPSEITPGSAEDWLRYARSDLALADTNATGGVLNESLCFHAQQAAEKSIKAVLILRGIEFPFTHNVAHLITLVQNAGIDWPQELDSAARLTRYAVSFRYPGRPKLIADTERQQAAAIARKVLEWAQDIVSPGSQPT